LEIPCGRFAARTLFGRTYEGCLAKPYMSSQFDMMRRN
jgi:hypothetical protein